MSSRVGTAIPASRSTALSSAAVGFIRSIQTALSGGAASSASATFFSEDSDGTNTESMCNSGTGTEPTQQDLARFWQALHDGAVPHLRQRGGGSVVLIRRPRRSCPKINRNRRICDKKDTASAPRCGASLLA